MVYQAIMKRGRSILLSVLEIDSYCYVRCGVLTRLAMRRVGLMMFLLELEDLLEVAGVMHVS